VAVDVGRDGVRRVPEVLLDDLGVGSGCQQEARCGVPESVQGDAAEAGSLSENLEAPQDVAGLEGCPDLGGEDQAVLLPGPCGRVLFVQLPGPALRSGQSTAPTAGSEFTPGQRLTHRSSSAVKIGVTPAWSGSTPSSRTLHQGRRGVEKHSSQTICGLAVITYAT
jgi:hypothetical protein